MTNVADEPQSKRIAFDAAKSAANFEKHGLRFEDFLGFDGGSSVTLPDERKDYGEVRYRSFGRIRGLPYMIVFTLRDEELRLISFRRAHEKEIRHYEH